MFKKKRGKNIYIKRIITINVIIIGLYIKGKKETLVTCLTKKEGLEPVFKSSSQVLQKTVP